MTYVFQLEIQMAPGQEDTHAALTAVLSSIATEFAALKKPGQDPPFRLTVVDLGHNKRYGVTDTKAR